MTRVSEQVTEQAGEQVGEQVSGQVGEQVGERWGRRGRSRAAGPARDRTRQTFSDLVDLAALPQGAYAVDEEVDGSLCLIRTGRGVEVFHAVEGTRQEVRVFGDEEAAYFYLFGLLAAEAVGDGRLVPHHLHQG